MWTKNKEKVSEMKFWETTDSCTLKLLVTIHKTFCTGPNIFFWEKIIKYFTWGFSLKVFSYCWKLSFWLHFPVCSWQIISYMYHMCKLSHALLLWLCYYHTRVLPQTCMCKMEIRSIGIFINWLSKTC